jgi:hypothetical protein
MKRRPLIAALGAYTTDKAELPIKRYFIVTPPPADAGSFSLNRWCSVAQDQPGPMCNVQRADHVSIRRASTPYTDELGFGTEAVAEDDCVACGQDGVGHGPDGGPKFKHIDLWIGGKGGTVSKVIACEDALTQSGTVIVNPPSNEAVSSTPLFNSSGNKCFKP